MPETAVKFNTRPLKALGALAAGLLTASSAGAATGLSCPSYQGKAGLSQVELSDGPPSGQAFLAPDVTVEGKDGFTNRWVLGPSRLGYWTRCRYGRAVLDVKLPAGLRQCTIRYDAAQKVIRNGLQPSCR